MEVDYDVQSQEPGDYRRMDITMIGSDVDELNWIFWIIVTLKTIDITTKL